MSADPLRQHIPTPAQIEAVGAACERLGRIAQQAADSVAEAFATAARQMELERWEFAESRREAQWHRQQEKAILRQQLDCNTSTFGRKRRWRRARGRRIEARRMAALARSCAAWTPGQISGLSCWHSSDHPLVQDGRIVGLRDLSGNGRPLLGEPWEGQADG